mgnify:FL=1
MRLQGKVAIITGGGGGIGRATAVRFAQEGARLLIADINEEECIKTVNLVKEIGGTAEFIRTDVTKAEEVEKMVDETIRIFGKLDILFKR